MNSAVLSTSQLLAQHGFRHAFFTRRGGVSTGPFESMNFSVTVGDSKSNVTENIARAATTLGVDRAHLYFLSQVHGADVVELVGNEDRDEVVERRGDAVVSSRSGVAIGVRIADCVPILVGDIATGAAVAIHAGWRGLVAGVVESGVAALARFGGGPAGFVAAIGPHITVTAFEVSDDVAETLRACSPNPSVIDRSRGPKPHVDLAEIAASKLEKVGLDRANVDRVAGCTFGEPDRFFSFRRDGARSGRHLAAIVPRAA